MSPEIQECIEFLSEEFVRQQDEPGVERFQVWIAALHHAAEKISPLRAVRSTHTYAVLPISPQAYREIKGKLEAACYQHAFMSSGEIDMHGIAIDVDPLVALSTPTDPHRPHSREAEGIEADKTC